MEAHKYAAPDELFNGEIGGPLNQFSTVGFKLETNGATILYPERLLRMMSCSSYSSSDSAN